MYLLGLQATSFILTLGIILLISGAIMYYCIRKFALLEASIIDQGKILHSFINRIQSNSIPTQNNNNINKETYLYESNINNISEKIEVSDHDSDSGSESDGDSESYSGSDSESDSDSERISVNDNQSLAGTIHSEIDLNNSLEIKDLNIADSVKIISMNDINLNTFTDQYVVDINTASIDSDIESLTNASSIIEDSLIEDVTVKNEVTQEIKKGGITKMKVSELRDLVVSNGLVETIDEANKLKKENLIKLLQ